MALTGELRWYPAPGKLNLFLHVLGRRADGMHELQTVFRLIDRADRVGIGVREDGEIRFSGPFGEDNLCARAARLLKKIRNKKRRRARIAKEPSCRRWAGRRLSDAASVLWALNRLWNLELSVQELMVAGLRLGADVPIFLFGATRLAGVSASACRRSIWRPPGTWF
jgi:4-diphosphocytidyl-2-C-methyl-D-erythritol kinase